jgi:hypothetical protein
VECHGIAGCRRGPPLRVMRTMMVRNDGVRGDVHCARFWGHSQASHGPGGRRGSAKRAGGREFPRDQEQSRCGDRRPARGV